jgi:hypothetical protein
VGQLLAQARVVALESGRLPFGRAQLSAASPSRSPHPHRPDHQQAKDEPERGRHGQQLTLAVTGDRVLQCGDTASGGVLHHEIAHQDGTDECQQ